MDNDLNNNTDNNVNVGNVIPNATTGDTAQVVPTPVSSENIQPIVSPASNIVTGESVNSDVSAIPQTVSAQPTVSTPQTTVNTVEQTSVVTETPIVNTTQNVTPSATVQPNVTNTKSNDEIAEKAYYKNIYTMMGIIVGAVLLIAGILLYFLLNGTIENRNRLTCTKTIQGEGYQEHIKRYYTFDNGLMMRVYLTHTYTYDELTDDIYDQTFGDVIKDEKQPISKYGFGTNVMRKDNVVTVTAYDVNYFEDTDKDVQKQNKDEGYTCE